MAPIRSTTATETTVRPPQTKQPGEESHSPSVGMCYPGDARRMGETMKQHPRAFQECYENQLLAYPDMEGKVGFNVEVRPNGTTGYALIRENKTESLGLGACIVRQVKRVKFQPQQRLDSCWFSWSFYFRPAPNVDVRKPSPDK